MEGCTLGGVFIVFQQEIQQFGRLSMLSSYFMWSGHAQKGLCGSHDPVHLVFGAIWWEMLKIVYPLIPSHYILPPPKVVMSSWHSLLLFINFQFRCGLFIEEPW